MSIIHEALKKTQNGLINQEHKKEKPKAAAPPPAAPQQPQPQRGEPSRAVTPPNPALTTTPSQPVATQKEKSKLPFVFFMLIALAGLSFYFLTDQNNIALVKGLKQRLQKQFFTSPPQSSKALPEARISSASRLKLDGTVKMEDHYVALINGEVFEVGENVGDYIIVAIDLRKVTLSGPDGPFVLTTKKTF